MPPPHIDVEELTPRDYQVREIVLGKPTLDTAKLLVTTGMKEVFKNLEQDEEELITLQKKNEILKGYLNEVVGPLDPEHPEETLNATLEKRDKEAVQLDPFLKSCQQCEKVLNRKVYRLYREILSCYTICKIM